MVHLRRNFTHHASNHKKSVFKNKTKGMEEFLYCPNAMTAWVPGSVEIILDYSNCDNLAGAWGHPDSFLEADVQKEIFQCVLRIKLSEANG